MKAAFQKDDALLADIDAARRARRARIWWLGQSGFLAHIPPCTILFDPYLSDSLTDKYAGTDKPHVRMTERVIAPERLSGIDIVTSSHSHTDHLDADTLRPLLAENPGAAFVIPRASRALALERVGPLRNDIVELDAGEEATVAGVRFYGIPAAHNTVERDERGCCKFLGYVAIAGGRTIYHSGDTLLHDGLIPALLPFKPEVALLPINGNRPERRVAGNLDGREAARVAYECHAGVVIPHHFDMFDFNTASPEEFERECRQLGQAFRTLRNGEGMDL